MDYTRTFPDYKKKGILNLVATFRKAGGDDSCPYSPLELGLPKNIKDYKNVIFLVLDGLGYNYLKRAGEGTFLQKSLVDRLSTVFPSTTASAITSYLTGVSPSEHCLTGWYTYIKELATASTILTFSPRYTAHSFTKCGVKSQDIYHYRGLADKIDTEFYHISSKHIINTPFAMSHSGNAVRMGYEEITQIPDLTMQALTKSRNRKFLFLYISSLDKLAHEYGIDSKETYDHLLELDRLISDLTVLLNGTDTLFLACADHGFLSSEPDKIVYMSDHPELRECLIMPLMGEPRVPYCYVRPAKVDTFLSYIEENFSDICEVKTAAEMVSEGWFGPELNNPALFERIGDYILLLRDNYVFQDNLPLEKKMIFKGYHGGPTAEEMYVPLLIFKS